MYEKRIKRILDIVLSALAIVILSPVFLVIAIIIRKDMGSPVLFAQERIGKDEKPFKLYKFRSMTNDKDKDGNLLPEEQRLTKTGKIIRSLSIDELPELTAILKGEMSFVGPRPLPTYYGPYFFKEERKRHTVKGGLIPADDLSGKVMTTWEEQFRYDVYYASHVSFGMDMKVICMTFKILLDRVKTDYGSNSIERPHLNVYRGDMTVDR